MSSTNKTDIEKIKDNRKSTDLIDNLMGYMTRVINEADETAAAARVAKLRAAQPDASSDELVEMLIKQKCFQTGAVGAVTSGAAIIPGLGTLTSLTFGVAADIGLTFKLQAELVLEIAELYQRNLSPAEKRSAVLLVTGISTGTNRVLSRAGKEIAEKVSERLAQKSVAKAVPVIGVAASAGTNVLSTYLIGQRAKAYFSLGPEAMGDWAENARALTGVDERKIIGWLTNTTERSWGLLGQSARNASGALLVAGEAAGEIVVVGANRASQTAATLGHSLRSGLTGGWDRLKLLIGRVSAWVSRIFQRRR